MYDFRGKLQVFYSFSSHVDIEQDVLSTLVIEMTCNFEGWRFFAAAQMGYAFWYYLITKDFFNKIFLQKSLHMLM